MNSFQPELIRSKHVPSRLGWCLAGSVWLATLVGCPATHSQPCQTDAQCPDGRCREGGCGPQCLQDFECPPGELCRGGTCAAPPQCAQSADCAAGFSCVAEQCLCTKDSACAAQQACLAGKCAALPTCSSEADCSPLGRHCDLASGVCVAPCNQPTDCAPQLDPTLATALFACVNGVCEQHCSGDNTCLTAGQVCINGSCAAPNCQTFGDCPQGQYCTRATLGQCLPYQTCQSTAQCPANFGCRAFSGDRCPPAFPCSTEICQELPRCLIDADCTSSAPAYCASGHCQPTTSCVDASTCMSGDLCIADTCVPGGCRGLHDCSAGLECVDGVCSGPPSPGEVENLVLAPRTAVIAVGDSLQLSLIAYASAEASFPESNGTFTVTEPGGAPSSAIAIDSTGRATAVIPGSVVVHGSINGSSATPATSQITVYSPTVPGRRVIVVDAATRTPLASVSVLACDSPPVAGPCPLPVLGTTDSSGAATFAFVGSTWTVSGTAPNVRADGYPQYDRVSVLGTSANTVLLPLTDNPIHGAAGFTGEIDFHQVHSQGALQLGVGLASVGNPVDLDLQTLFGEPFAESIPGTSQPIALPGSSVVQLALPFGGTASIKSTLDSLGQAGTRTASGFGGNFDPQLLTTLGSTDLVAYVGAMDYALAPFNALDERPRVQGTPDAGPNGLPDYSSFPSVPFSPHRVQQTRTEVVLPDLPAGLNTALVGSIEAAEDSGLSLLGLASRTGGTPHPDGTRPLGTLLLQSGAPYAGVEAGQPGIWVFGVALATQAMSGRSVLSTTLPSRAVVAPLLPLPLGSTYSAQTRTLGLPQPLWNAIGSAGAVLAEIALIGPDSRHVVYWPLDGAQSSIRIPESPNGAGTDAADRASTWGLSALQFQAGVTATDALDLPGVNLLVLPTVLEAYSRAGP